MMFGDESFALRQTMCVSADDAAGAIINAVTSHRESIKGHIHTDTGKTSYISVINQGIEVGHHIPFDVVFPSDHAPTLTRFDGLHDGRYIR